MCASPRGQNPALIQVGDGHCLPQRGEDWTGALFPPLPTLWLILCSIPVGPQQLGIPILTRAICLQAGETVVAADCSETCTCSSTRGLACEAWGCPPGQICVHQAGAPTCISEDGQCRLAPGTQFTSFDGAVGPAPSRGAYVMASLCNTSTPSWFRVVVHARGPEAPTWAPGVVVHGFFGDSVITLRRDNKAWVSKGGCAALLELGRTQASGLLSPCFTLSLGSR